MKYIITEQQYDFILNEQSEIVKIGCHDYDSIPQYCQSLRLSKGESDQIITANRDNANKELSNSLNALSQELLSLGGKEGERVAKKFSSAIKNAKIGITQVLSKYYSQSIYASSGLSKEINMPQVLLEVCNILYSEFLKAWDSSFIEKNAAKLFVTNKNISIIQKEAEDIWYQIVNQIQSNIEYYFIDSGYSVVDDYVRQKQKSAPKCDNVKIIQDEGCKKFPKEKWYSPNKTYKIVLPIPSGRVNSTELATRTYLPKLKLFLNQLV